MPYETDVWPRIDAKYKGAKRTGAPRLIVIHTPQWREDIQGAEQLGRYLANPESPKSYHVGVDSDTVVQYVLDSFIAYAAPGANHDGMQISIVGRAEQSKLQWRDNYSLCALALAADVVAQYCLKYNIGPTRLTADQVRSGNRGITDHATVSQVYRRSTHTDPGLNFPWTRFVMYVKGAYEDRRGS